MLAFIDESGIPVASDRPQTTTTARPVVVAACFDERDARSISSRLHALKRDILGREGKELKGSRFLDRGTYRNKHEYRTFAAEFFGAVCTMPVTIFSVIMRGPFGSGQDRGSFLERRFQFLLERINLLALEQDTMAAVVFDGDHGSFRGLSDQFTRFLYRSHRGRAMERIADAPYFVDSANSVEIQIADMCGYVIREYHENRLNDGPASSEHRDYYWLSALRRWYPSGLHSTRDFNSSQYGVRHGFHFFHQPGDR